MNERLVTNGVGRSRVRGYLWLAAGWLLLGLGVLLVVIPLVSFSGFGLVVLAGPLILAGLLVLLGVSWARWLGVVVIAAYTVAVWYVITTPLRGLQPAAGQTEPIGPVALAAGVGISLVALTVVVLLLAGQRQVRA